MTQLTLGSLFDGIGGFPLAGIYSGMNPIWASEIEPFPIRVTTARFPNMKHYGDIHDLNGGEIEPVDVITFGSPCTDLSVAGKRSGLGGAQSSLFFEAVRVITEMREKTNGTQPRWLVWENVPGALSSARGSDFRAVLESLVRVKDPEAAVPMPDTGKWMSAGEIRGRASALGGDYSLAWRILDAAKGWGVAQRRRRVFVVVDLDGQRAGQVLFESEGVSRYTPPSAKARQGAAGGAETGAGTSGGKRGTGLAVEFNPTDSRIKLKDDGICQTLTSRMGTGGNTTPLTLTPRAYGICSDQSNAMLSNNPHSGVYEADTSRTLDCSGGSPSCNQGGIAIVEPLPAPDCLNPWDSQTIRQYDENGVYPALTANGSGGQNRQGVVIRTCAAFMGGQGAKASGLGYQEEMSPTLKSVPSGGNTVPDVVYALQGNMIGRKDENGPQGDGVNKDVCFTLNTIDRPAVACPEAHLASGKPQTGTLTARAAAQKSFLGNQEAFSGDYYVLEPAYSLDRAAFNQGQNAQFGISVNREQSQTLVSQGPNAVAQPRYGYEYLVRRLTPGECCRLQGYPDGWCENLATQEPTDAELHWWAGVFETWRKAQGKSSRPRSQAQILKWLKNPRTDAAEYKAYGNSVAVPCVFFVLAGIMWATETEESACEKST